MANPYKKEDPREVYARRHREGGMERVNKIVTAQLPATAKSKKKKQLPPRFDQFQYRQQQEEAEDVRFVKRRFPKDGSRAALPSPPKGRRCHEQALAAGGQASPQCVSTRRGGGGGRRRRLDQGGCGRPSGGRRCW